MVLVQQNLTLEYIPSAAASRAIIATQIICEPASFVVIDLVIPVFTNVLDDDVTPPVILSPTICTILPSAELELG